MKQLSLLLLAGFTSGCFAVHIQDPCWRLVRDWHNLNELQMQQRMDELSNCKEDQNRDHIRHLLNDSKLNRSTKRALQQIAKRINSEIEKVPATLENTLELYFLYQNEKRPYWQDLAIREYKGGARKYEQRVEEEICSPCWLLVQRWANMNNNEELQSDPEMFDCMVKREQLEFVIKHMDANPRLRKSLKQITAAIDAWQGTDTLEAAFARVQEAYPQVSIFLKPEYSKK